MKFYVMERPGISRESVLSYQPAEYAFDVEPKPLAAWTTILINDLNLEINEAGKIVSVWGLCPHTSWSERSLSLPNARYGDIGVESDVPFDKGVSVRLTSQGVYLPAFVDWNTGCVKIEGTHRPVVAATIIPGVTIELGQGGELASVWLAPQNGLARSAGQRALSRTTS